MAIECPKCGNTDIRLVKEYQFNVDLNRYIEVDERYKCECCKWRWSTNA